MYRPCWAKRSKSQRISGISGHKTVGPGLDCNVEKSTSSGTQPRHQI